MTDLRITKSNNLLDASYRLNANAQKLVLSCVAKLNPQGKPESEISITASEYAEIMGVPLSDDVYRDLYRGADALFDAYISISEGDTTKRYRWVQEDAIKRTGEGTVTLVWSNHILRHLYDLNRDFKTYNIKHIAHLDTGHAIRLYELLIKFDKTGWREMSIEDLKTSMGIADKYPEYKELNRRVITPAVKQLNINSNITVTFKTKKKGRKIVGLRFEFKIDDQMALPFDKPGKTKEAGILVDENSKKLVEKYGNKSNEKSS
jgi:plasmid replication initiation protein